MCVWVHVSQCTCGGYRKHLGARPLLRVAEAGLFLFLLFRELQASRIASFWLVPLSLVLPQELWDYRCAPAGITGVHQMGLQVCASWNYK